MAYFSVGASIIFYESEIHSIKWLNILDDNLMPIWPIIYHCSFLYLLKTFLKNQKRNMKWNRLSGESRARKSLVKANLKSNLLHIQNYLSNTELRRLSYNWLDLPHIDYASMEQVMELFAKISQLN